MNCGSLQVDLGMGVRGLIPSEHMFDQVASSEFRGKVFHAKYAVGAQVDVRVLTIDATEKRCLLTAKETMVKDAENAFICDFADAQQGQKAVRYVSNIFDQGLFVNFFGRVYGKVTAKSLWQIWVSRITRKATIDVMLSPVGCPRCSRNLSSLPTLIAKNPISSTTCC